MKLSLFPTTITRYPPILLVVKTLLSFALLWLRESTSILCVDAFVFSVSRPTGACSTTTCRSASTLLSSIERKGCTMNNHFQSDRTLSVPWSVKLSVSTTLFSHLNASPSSESQQEKLKAKLCHSDIEWRLRPPEDTPMMEKLKLQAAANAIRTECLLRDEPVPPVLCPKGGRAVLEAYDNRNGKGKKKIGRFGITTTRGPPAPMIDETIEEIYNINVPFNGAGVAAIIYMYVEPEYRKLGVGELALEAIAAIQTVQGCDFTVLVADDNGSNKLIAWYENNGFTVVPTLQDIFGSPGGKYGITMIRPTQVASDIFARCQIKWW